MMDFTLFGIAGAVLIPVIMEFIKYIFPELQDRWMVVATVGVGVLLSGLAYLVGISPAAAKAAEVLLTGFLSGLGACGVFSVVKKRAE